MPELRLEKSSQRSRREKKEQKQGPGLPDVDLANIRALQAGVGLAAVAVGASVRPSIYLANVCASAWLLRTPPDITVSRDCDPRVPSA